MFIASNLKLLHDLLHRVTRTLIIWLGNGEATLLVPLEEIGGLNDVLLRNPTPNLVKAGQRSFGYCEYGKNGPSVVDIAVRGRYAISMRHAFAASALAVIRTRHDRRTGSGIFDLHEAVLVIP